MAVDDFTGAVAEINLTALKANYQLLADRVSPQAACSAVVKANAYGLGAPRVALALETAGCKRFFVISITEAIELRAAVPHAFIGVFYGVANKKDAQQAVAQRFVPVLNSLEQVGLWREAARECGKPLPAILHAETGISRLGFSLKEISMLAEDAMLLEGIEIHYIMSHLACAGMPEHALNVMQLQRFNEARAFFPDVPASLANSSGIFLGHDYHFDLARPGSALYGINPVPYRENPMQTVVTLKAPLLQVRVLEQEETVGYNATYVAPKGARLATAAIGYADGLIRALGNRSTAYVAGHEVPIAGIVSMDLTVLDVSSLPENAVHAGQWAEFIGPHLPVDDVAARAGTIGYELFTSLGVRVKRVYI